MPPTRRDFLARSAALTAGVLLTGCEGNNSQTLRSRKQGVFNTVWPRATHRIE